MLPRNGTLTQNQSSAGGETPGAALAAPTPARAGADRCWSNTAKLSSLSLFAETQTLHQLAARLPDYKNEARMTFRTIVRDYCNHTAVHGFRYFFDASRSATERAFWVLAVFFSIGGCFYLMSKVWMKWELYPIMVTFQETTSSMWEFPFPAVTICPLIKSKRSLFDFTETRRKVFNQTATPEEVWSYDAMSMVCEPDMYNTPPKTFDRINKTPIDFLVKVAPTLEDVMILCVWRGRPRNCSEIFKSVLTDAGICFSFNSLGPRDLYSNDTVQSMEDVDGRQSSGWTEEEGYDNTNIGTNFPERQFGVDPFTGLQVIMKTFNEDTDYLCAGAELGFKVFLHSPTQPAHLNQYSTILPCNASMHVVASPSVMTTSSLLRTYPQQRRACIFPSEEPGLRFYKQYSQEKCLHECVANMTLRHCNCTLFSSPRLPGMQVCDQYFSCALGYFEKALHYFPDGSPRYVPVPVCNTCLPSCFSLYFNAETAVSNFPWREALQARQLSIPTGNVSFSRLKVYLQKMQVITSQRREMYGTTDFLANCGGLLGLFSGFSVVSLVEIVYYMSLRLVCHLRRRRSAPSPASALRPRTAPEQEQF